MKNHLMVAVAVACAFLVATPVQAQSPVADTFDADLSGWQTFGGLSPQMFQHDDGTSGNCFAGGCAAANSANTIARMYQAGTNLAEGALTVYARVKVGIQSSPNPFISLCKPGTECADGARLDLNITATDDTWHQYLVAWRQGATAVEYCFLTDSSDLTGCTWSESLHAAGTTFDAVGLWSARGFRSDLGNNLWFDELASFTPAPPADTTAPVLAEVTPVATPAEDTTPEYTFSSTEAGTITYGGACSSATTAAAVGNTTVTFSTLLPATYTDCTIVVTDTAGNASTPLAVSSFSIVTPEPPTLTPTAKDQCKGDGWRDFTHPVFKNQGSCVSYVATGGKK